ncbi:SDR family NAD(P)-dependent oxidoreductase [Sphingobacterium chungjuense]|uniref:SDR family NAD(P)-dependent oxidoreductase n=1 Tax=Sphingobacterium chungjuense TaxID=2675553 RepID=UPI00293B9BF9|nr:glucose 1-dehydrogenase [Sphingobacterium chungjuense]
MMSRLENKVAIVTGAGSGIGQAIAELFASNGAKVVVSDISVENGKAAVDKINAAGGDAIFVKADSSSAEDNKNLVATTVEHYGRLDIACNNAGIGGPAQPTGEYDIDAWDKVIRVNLNGVFYGCRYQLEQMGKNGGGNIVNIASIHGTVAAPLSSAYTATKHAVVGLTKNIAAEYATKNIRCNTVGPGYVLTPLLENNLTQEMQDGIAAKAPMNRLGTPDEIAKLVLFLSSDDASFVTGAYYIADGGYTVV